MTESQFQPIEQFDDSVTPLSHQQRLLDTSAIYTVPIDSLLSSESPRLQGEDPDHIQALVETEEEFPPIWVHQPTRKVIDGMHRVRAAVLLGMTDIKVRFFHGSESDLFLLSISANIRHGLPLSQDDRVAAAQRIFTSHPEWSDRMVASLTGLSPKRVATMRLLAATDTPQPERRLGRDGRLRPVDGAQGRQRAAEIIKKDPSASLRQIAKAAGISPATAADVRHRIARGNCPVPSGGSARAAQTEDAAPAPSSPDGLRRDQDRLHAELASVLSQLCRDPSLRLNEKSRSILRMFDIVNAALSEPAQILEQLPPHCRMSVAELSNGYAQILQAFAQNLDRVKTGKPPLPC